MYLRLVDEPLVTPKESRRVSRYAMGSGDGVRARAVDEGVTGHDDELAVELGELTTSLPLRNRSRFLRSMGDTGVS